MLASIWVTAEKTFPFIINNQGKENLNSE